MKKLITLILIILSLSLRAAVIEKTFHFSDFTISQIDEYQTISFKNTQQQARTGEPVLPYSSLALLLPPGHIAESIQIIGLNEIQLPDTYQLYPKQQVRPVSLPNSNKFSKNLSIYNSSSKYPQQLHGELITQNLHGYSIALSTFTLVNYIPLSGQLSYYEDIRIIINTKPDINAENALKNLQSKGYVLNKVKINVQNPEMIVHYPNIQTREGEYELMIIAPEQFENDFAEMREVYLKQGLISEVKTVESIYSEIPGQDQPEKIRNYIIQEYQDHDIEYVLLAGDVEHIPYRGLYCTVDSGGGYEDNDIPSDLYFSALDGNWNNDGDNNWGEIGEDDLLPEVAVARFSFSTSAELNNMLNKTINYQTQPVLGELRDPLMAGEAMYDNPQTWGADYLDMVIGFHDENGYETSGIPNEHNITTMYDRDLGSWSASELIFEINQGHSFIHHAGHANYEYAMRLINSDITNANFNQVNGIDHNFTFVYTHGCNCGSFDHNDGIAERMININNFAVAFVGNSRYGWFNEGQTEGPSSHIHREFTDALYTDKYYRIGRAHMESKTATAPWVTAPGQWEEGALRWCFYDCNVLGGSALPIWTDEPIAIEAVYSPVITIGTSSFEVELTSNSDPVSDLQCTILQNGALIGTALTDENGIALITFDPAAVIVGDAELYVSGYNRPLQEYQLQVIPSGYFVAVLDYSVESGNDDMIEFGENCLLTLILEEVGTTGDVHNAMIELSSSDEYIEIIDSIENVGIIPSGSLVELADAFNFDVSADIPDLHNIHLSITISSDEGSWESELNLTGYNAELELNNVEIIDAENQVLDPGETVELAVALHNIGGADIENLIPIISSSNSNVIITNYNTVTESLNSNETVDILVCSVEVSNDIQIGEIINFNLEAAADNDFNFSEEFNLVVGISIEDFESADFSAYDWEFGGEADWIIDDQAYEGVYSARSGDIGHDSFTSLNLSLEVSSGGEVSFWKKISTEFEFDFMRFFIDDILQEEWSGNFDWSESSFPLSAGLHTLRWEYVKDTYVTGGDDRVWLDYIIFPPLAGEVHSEQALNINVSKLIGNFPNPFKPSGAGRGPGTTISFQLNSQTGVNVEIIIYNIKGQKVRTLVNREFTTGTHNVNWNGSDDHGRSVSSGLYFYRIRSRGLDQTKKMILMK
ncbi:MAG: T9SS type A sorting domain-containing protein [Candidatus Cloacimonetes bacterium]|nr:T9SS type A sorting domain-containing protein [Candidatus Cloacimonadota bacterium]